MQIKHNKLHNLHMLYHTVPNILYSKIKRFVTYYYFQLCVQLAYLSRLGWVLQRSSKDLGGWGLASLIFTGQTPFLSSNQQC